MVGSRSEMELLQQRGEGLPLGSHRQYGERERDLVAASLAWVRL